MKLNQPPKPFKVTLEILRIFFEYLRTCSYDGKAFTGINNFKRFEPIREVLLQHIVNSIVEQIALKLFKSMQYNDSKVITIKLNYAERITLSVLFKRVQIPSELAPLELQILNRLIIEKK